MKLENPSQWKGVWTALITPFDAQNKLDTTSLAKLIEMQINAKVTGLVIAGSTGEGSLLTNETYSALLKAAVSTAQGRIPIVAGLGIGGTRECLERATLAITAGVSGLLASPPAYIKTPARGLVEHYKKIASLGLPLCLYDVPSRSAVGLADEVVDELLKSEVAPRIHALKDATGKPERIQHKDHWKNKMALLSGDDESFPDFMRMGGHGIISVATHFALKEFIDIQKSEKHSAERFEKITSFIKALYWESNPIPTKSLAHRLGWIAHPTFQEPLCPMTSELLEDLHELYRKEFT
jgi:4-hydroxy-tetrahydrodipicolinate synthase